MKKLKLVPTLIPETSFFRNLRAILEPSEWRKIGKKVRIAAGGKCEICGGRGTLDCHEVWEYSDGVPVKKLVQRLVRLEALCKKCHLVRHFGYAEVQGLADVALKHMMKVNNATEEECGIAIRIAFAEWEARSSVKWKLDTSKLEEYR